MTEPRAARPALDLEAIKARWSGDIAIGAGDIPALLAEVQALCAERDQDQALLKRTMAVLDKLTKENEALRHNYARAALAAKEPAKL